MRGGLFWRVFGAILIAVVLTVLIFTGIMATSLQQQQQESYEHEVALQAHEIADSMASLNQISSLWDNVTMQNIIRAKVQDIHDR